MKISIKKSGIEAEGNLEEIAKKVIDNAEIEWKEKLESKTKSQKELLELKHKNKLENKIIKRLDNKKLQKYYEKRKIKELNEQEKTQKIYKVLSIIMFFIYGIFTILAFQNLYIVPLIIGIIQLTLITIAIFSTMDCLKLFKNDYKICFMISLLLIIPWLAFAI